MFNWLRRLVSPSEKDERQQFYETIDALNAESGGGKPTLITKFLGNVKLRSGTLFLSDPQYVELPGIEVPNIASDKVCIYASLWQYPRESAQVAALTVRMSENEGSDSRRKIGELAIDSAKLVMADKADIEEHWMEVGKDRIGVFPTAHHGTLLRSLCRRFHLETVRVNYVRAEVVGPVSEQLEEEIEAWLKSDPRYADYPFMRFYVQTNNSFERANFMEAPWGFMPVGNCDTPLMFVCRTGRGDGVYDVECEFLNQTPVAISINFIDEEGARII